MGEIKIDSSKVQQEIELLEVCIDEIQRTTDNYWQLIDLRAERCFSRIEMLYGLGLITRDAYDSYRASTYKEYNRLDAARAAASLGVESKADAPLCA